jgi:hypothetical protein
MNFPVPLVIKPQSIPNVAKDFTAFETWGNIFPATKRNIPTMAL